MVCNEMKLLVIILSSFLWCAQSNQELKFKEEWKKFQRKYGKSYRSPVEAQKRFTIFKENWDHINAHNALFEKGESTFKKGINIFADWSKDEFKQYLNQGLSQEEAENDGKETSTDWKVASNDGKVFEKSKNFKAPKSVDWRNSGAVSDVKAQGICGACWAFSTTGAIEGQLRIVKGINASLSEQALIDCNESNAGCESGWPYKALEYVQYYGIQREQDYAYTGEDGSCRNHSSKIVTKISSYENIKEGDEQALQEAISKKGPVSICLYASYNFYLYSAGILREKHCPHNTFNHGALAVGFGSENGLDYYIVKNSWGPDWGEAGYIRLARNNDNMCGLASRAVIPTL